MALIKRMKIYFWCSFVMLTILSMTFLVMPLSNKIGGIEQRVVLVVVGGTFWISLILGYVFLFLAKSVGRRLNQASSISGTAVNNENKDVKWFKKIRFFVNVPTSAADTAFISALIVLVVLNLIGNTRGYVVYVDLFILTFSFNVHLLFSGNLYKSVGWR